MRTFHIKEGDTSPGIIRELTDAAGNPVNLDGASARFQMRPRQNTFYGPSMGTQTATPFLNEPAEILQYTDSDGNYVNKGQVRYGWADDDTDTPGKYICEFRISYGDQSIETFPNYGHIHVTIHEDV